MRAEVVIAGGGAAGAALACGLAMRGRRALVLERAQAAQDKVCGEFVSVEAAEALARLGLDLGPLGARPLPTFRLVAGREVAECVLPFPAYGLSRRRLDHALLARARALGADVQLGAGVTRLEGGAATLAGGEQARGEAVALATGKHEMRGRARRAVQSCGWVGLKTHLRLSLPGRRLLGEAVEVHLFRGGYAGLQPVEGGLVNLCVAVDPHRLAEARGSLPALLRAVAPPGSPLAERLAGAEAVLARPLAVGRIPYGFRSWRESDDPDWLWRLGDQAAVTPSFTGDGLAIALRSAALAAEALSSDAPPHLYRRRLRAAVGPQLARATALDRLLASAGGRRLAARVGRQAPALLRLAASATRLPHRAG